MTVTRFDLADYLDTQFSALAAAVGQDGDPETGYAPDIDAALRKLGVARSSLQTATLEDTQEEAAFALAEFYTLRRVRRLLGDRIKHNMGTTAYDPTGQVAAVEAMLKEAKQAVTALGYDVTGEGWSVGWLNEDWLEPEVAW